MNFVDTFKGFKSSFRSADTEDLKIGFNTFFGVFLPSMLSIFGVIMYLRLGWLLGNIGFVPLIVIICLSSLITFITGLSISATATNINVKGGGAYYMLSRSFGVELGAAIGIPLYFAQVIGVAFYIEGFSEAFSSVFPAYNAVFIELFVASLLTVLAFWSADIAMKSQTVIFAIICLSLLSIFYGEAPAATNALEISSSQTSPLAFWAAFAIFFPAVTGIEAGFSMSGDLRNPRKALPVGTLSAVMVGLVVYLCLAYFLYSSVPQSLLAEDPLIVQHISWFQPLVVLGIWGATLSSAMGGILGAPRTLQALSKDGVVPRFLGKGFGQLNEPRIATCVSFILIGATLFIGDINLIAPILTMFFLVSYGMLNFATGLETLLKNPSWRPTFFTSSVVSIFGGILCIIVMFMIDPGATFITSVLIGIFYAVVRKVNHGKKWDDIRDGVSLYLTRKMVYYLSDTKLSTRAWRPNLLVFTGSPQYRTHLIEFASSLTRDKGFLTTVSIIPHKTSSYEKTASLEKTIKEYYRKKGIKSLVEVELAENIFAGMKRVITNYGLGSIVPNTVVIGDSLKDDQYGSFTDVINLVNDSHKNLVIIKGDDFTEQDNINDKIKAFSGNIDIWWDDKNLKSSHLMVVLAHMLQSSPAWKKHTVTIKCIVPNESAREMRMKYFEEFFEKSRLDLDIKILVVDEEKESFSKTVHRFSDMEALVFLAMTPPQAGQDSGKYSEYYSNLMMQNKQIPHIAYVMSSEYVDLKDIFN